MHPCVRLFLAGSLAALGGCGQWIADAATSTSLDADGGCRLDDWGGRLVLLADDEVTVFARGYSDERFCALRIGMPEAEVRALLGEPLSEVEHEPGEATLHYSASDEDTHYRQRSVRLAGGQVTGITAGVYID
jgi:hypothetical protein